LPLHALGPRDPWTHRRRRRHRGCSSAVDLSWPGAVVTVVAWFGPFGRGPASQQDRIWWPPCSRGADHRLAVVFEARLRGWRRRTPRNATGRTPRFGVRPASHSAAVVPILSTSPRRTRCKRGPTSTIRCLKCFLNVSAWTPRSSAPSGTGIIWLSSRGVNAASDDGIALLRVATFASKQSCSGGDLDFHPHNSQSGKSAEARKACAENFPRIAAHASAHRRACFRASP